MNIFDRFKSIFSNTASIEHNYSANNHTPVTNPSTGLQMSGSIDIGGNVFGSSPFDAHRSAMDHQNINNSISNHSSALTSQAHDYNNYNSFNNPFNNY